MEIRQNLIDKSKYSLKCPNKLTVKYIVVHNTANDASAENEITYMKSTNVSTSFHFAVDDKEIVQGIPLERNAWHAGDGANGKGNRYGIGIEICYSKSGGERFLRAEINAAKLIAYLLKKYELDISAVITHQSCSGKYCPHRTLAIGWDRFIDMIKNELGGKKMETRYRNIGEVPEWGKTTIQKLINKGYLAGTGNSLDLSLDMVRIFVINDKAGVYGD